jgi:hypothetical protein
MTEVAQNQGRPVAGGAVIARNEGAEGYPRLVVQLDAKTRVIECMAGIQWIVQRRLRNGRHAWEGVSFCRTKQALLRCVREWISGEHPEIEALPNRFLEALPQGAAP